MYIIPLFQIPLHIPPMVSPWTADILMKTKTVEGFKLWGT